MTSPIDNEVDLPPPPYPSAPEASENLGCDGKTNLPGAPPTYEEATDPTFMQRFQMFSEGFHPAEVSRLTRQMTRQMSRNNQDPGNEARETNAQEFEMNWGLLLKFILFLLIFPLFLIAMVAVGSYYFGECDTHSPHPMWLIVGGLSTIAAFLLTGFAMFARGGPYMCAFILFVVPIFWFFYGCYIVFGGSTYWMLDEDTTCDGPLYFVYAVVVIPFVMFGLVVAKYFLKRVYKKCC